MSSSHRLLLCLSILTVKCKVCNFVITVQWSWSPWSSWSNCSLVKRNPSGIQNSIGISKRKRRCEYDGKKPSFLNCNGKAVEKKRCIIHYEGLYTKYGDIVSYLYPGGGGGLRERVHSMLRERVCATHMGWFLDRNFLNKGPFSSRISIDMGGLSRNWRK